MPRVPSWAAMLPCSTSQFCNAGMVTALPCPCCAACAAIAMAAPWLCPDGGPAGAEGADRPACCSTACSKFCGQAWALSNCCGNACPAVACCTKLLSKASTAAGTPLAGQAVAASGPPAPTCCTNCATSWVKASTRTVCCACGERLTELPAAACAWATAAVAAGAWGALTGAAAGTAAAGWPHWWRQVACLQEHFPLLGLVFFD